MYIASTSLLIALTFQRASNADLFSDLSISVTLKLKIWPRIQPGRSAKGQLLGYTGPIVAAELPASMHTASGMTGSGGKQCSVGVG